MTGSQWPGINSGVDTGDVVEGNLTTAFDGIDTDLNTLETGLAAVPAAIEADIDASVLERYDTGIIKGGEATLNVDPTKIDISETTYIIQGVGYIMAAVVGYSPDLQVGETARRIAFDASGIVDQQASFTTTQKQTILPICRVQAPQGSSGPGSTLLTPLPLDFRIGESGWLQRLWHEKTIGVLYASGGVISESVTPLQVDESAGEFFNAQRKDVPINGTSNITAVSVYHVAGTWALGTDQTLVIDNLQYDDGTDLVTLGNNQWASHTLLKSPKEDSEFFLIFSQGQYASQADAEAAEPSYGVFQSQAFSGLFAVAQIIIQKSSANINQIKDIRPFIGGTVGATLGTSNLQQTYENSTDPEITTINGALSIKAGETDPDEVFEVLNLAGSQVFYVTGEGDLIVIGSVDGRDVAADGTKLDGIEALADVTSTNETSHADVLVDSDIGIVVQGYDIDTAKTDTAQSWPAKQTFPFVAANDGVIDMTHTNFSVIPTLNETIENPTNTTDGQTGWMKIDASTYTISWGTNWEFEEGVVPTLTGQATIAYGVKSSTSIVASVINNVS